MSDLWERWGALTRSMISTRIAVERERTFWSGLDFTRRSEVKIKAKARDGAFTIKLGSHEQALEDEAALTSAALVLSYSLAEAAALEVLDLESRTVSGIEDWGGRLLKRLGRTWDEVEDGLAGAVEVAVARNLIVHGRRDVDALSAARLTKAGSKALAQGDQVALDHETVGLYRARLRSLLMCGGLGESGPRQVEVASPVTHQAR